MVTASIQTALYFVVLVHGGFRQCHESTVACRDTSGRTILKGKIVQKPDTVGYDRKAQTSGEPTTQRGVNTEATVRRTWTDCAHSEGTEGAV